MKHDAALFQAVAQAVGKDHAVTMFELIPPPETELATRADVESLRHELLAAFRSELTTAIAAQTRVMVMTTLGAVVGLGGLAVTLSQVL